MRRVFIFLKGMLMGTAETIPGVSGSTVALLVGIYDEFVDIIYRVSHFCKELVLFFIRKRKFVDIKKAFLEIPFKFAITLFLGMVFAILIFSKIIVHMLENYPSYTYAFLMGLVIPCLAIIGRQIDRKGLKEIVIATTTFILFFLLFGLQANDVSDPSALILFLGGVVSISAMVLPGISGSFVLLIIGLYHYVIGLVGRITDFDLTANEWLNLIIFGTGVLVGVLSSAQLLKYMLVNHKNIILAFLFGLVLASLRVLIPFVKTEVVDGEVEVERIGISEFSLGHITVLFLITIFTAVIILFLQKKSGSDTSIT